MATYEKKQSKSLTEKTKKYECSICGKKIRFSKKNSDICDTCKKLYGEK